MVKKILIRDAAPIIWFFNQTYLDIVFSLIISSLFRQKTDITLFFEVYKDRLAIYFLINCKKVPYT